MKYSNVLMVMTSTANTTNNTSDTGIWMEELAGPYYVFKSFAEEITFASPKGGAIPIDPASMNADALTDNAKRFGADGAAMALLEHSLPLAGLRGLDYNVVFIVGGHGAIWDMENNAPLTAILQEFIKADKPIGAVGSGVAALTPLLLPDGSAYIKGKKLTTYSNGEIALLGFAASLPYLIETKVLSLGASYSRSDDYSSHVVRDGMLITGQNPASSVDTALALKALAMGVPVAF